MIEVAGVQLIPGKRYKIRHQVEGIQQYPRESLLRFMGMGGTDGKKYIWDARPHSGTQEFLEEYIQHIEEMPDSEAIYINRRAEYGPSKASGKR